MKIPNIGPRGRRQRLTLGVVSFGVVAILGTVLLAFGVAPVWRLTLFLPLWLGALGMFQALDKT